MNALSYIAKGAETILLADDDPCVRTITRDILHLSGYTVIEAVDGKDGLERFIEYQDRVTILVFDMDMPGKNGRKAYEEIREIRPDIKVLFISGSAREAVIDGWDRNIRIGYLSKPFLPKELLQKIREMLDR
ncbi:MAG: Aerobic respiration control protein ArcA [Syntrophorhabdus sp. PtaU1.Bin058]|nr:MAG: Aerobic respiration control protein ArcA [Syntrophorhabdus sp. PtaU1.Bin058]